MKAGAALLIAVAAALGSPAPPAGAATRPAVRVMPLGDSITYGTSDPTLSGYRIPLQGFMARAGVRYDFVGSQRSGRCCDRDSEGHPGWNSRLLREHIKGWLVATPPDIVLLHIGTNDAAQGVTPQAYAANLTAILGHIRYHRPAAHVFVAKIIGTLMFAHSALVDRYNALIPGIVARAGYRTYLVDQTPIRGAWLADAHHPNTRGYYVMGWIWYQAIRRNIPGAAGWRDIPLPRFGRTGR